MSSDFQYVDDIDFYNYSEKYLKEVLIPIAQKILEFKPDILFTIVILIFKSSSEADISNLKKDFICQKIS